MVVLCLVSLFAISFGQNLKKISTVFSPGYTSSIDTSFDGFIQQIIGGPELPLLDPFVQLDFFQFIDISGYSDQVKVGVQSVMYVTDGIMHHTDSQGNQYNI